MDLIIYCGDHKCFTSLDKDGGGVCKYGGQQKKQGALCQYYVLTSKLKDHLAEISRRQRAQSQPNPTHLNFQEGQRRAEQTGRVKSYKEIAQQAEHLFPNN